MWGTFPQRYFWTLTKFNPVYGNLFREFSTAMGPNLSAKRARDLIKLVNSSSLTQSEKKRSDWREDTKIPEWKRQKLALEEKLKGEKWSPKKKLSREEINSVRILKQQLPKLTATQLGEQFKVSPEVIRRILKSKWQPTEEEAAEFEKRWKRRGERIKAMNPSASNSVETPFMPKKLIIGSGRSSSDILLKRVKWKSNLARDQMGKGQAKGKQGLNLLKKLVD